MFNWIQDFRSGLRLIKRSKGLALGVVLRRLSSGIMSFANPSDTAIYIGTLLLMLLVIGAACYPPARRASTVDPNVTLRS